MNLFSQRYAEGRRGFTLIEVIVAISIVAILSSIVIANVGEGRKKARDTQRINDIEQIRLALRLYRDAHNTYPQSEGEITPTSAVGVALTPFLSKIPEDPLTGDDEYGYYYDVLTCINSNNDSEERYFIYAAKMELQGSINIGDACPTPGNGVGSGGNNGGSNPQGAAYGQLLDSAYGESLGTKQGN